MRLYFDNMQNTLINTGPKNGSRSVIPMRGIGKFIVVYIALRLSMGILYDVNIIAEFNVLELAGFFFPVVLLSYWATQNFKTAQNNCKGIYFLVIFWVLSITSLKIGHYSSGGIESFSEFFRVLNGFAVFIVFPLIFRDRKTLGILMTAFFISTCFPLSQGLIQLLIGADFGVMSSIEGTTISGSEYIIYSGLYYKNEGYICCALFGTLIMIYKIGLIGRIQKLKMCVYIVFLVLYLIVASITLSRTLTVQLLVIWGMVTTRELVKRGAKNAESFLIIIVLILLPLIIYKWDFTRDRYEQLMNRSEKELQVLSGELEAKYALNARVGLWEYKLEMFNQRSFIERLTGTNIGIGPHSDYVEWLLHYGYVGITLYSILFLSLLVNSIKTFFRIKGMHGSYLQPYGFMVITGLIIWLLSAIAFTPSRYPDYAYFIIGNTAIFLSMGKKMLGQRSSSSVPFPLHTA